MRRKSDYWRHCADALSLPSMANLGLSATYERMMLGMYYTR